MMDGPFDSFPDRMIFDDEDSVADDRPDDPLKFATLEDLGLLVQARVVTLLSQATSAVHRAREEECEKLIIPLEAFLEQANLMRGDNSLFEECIVESEIQLEPGEAREQELPASYQWLEGQKKKRSRQSRNSAAPSAIQWDFQMVRFPVFSLLLFFPQNSNSILQLPNVVNICSISNISPLSLEFWARPSKMGNHPSFLCVASEDVLLALDRATVVSHLSFTFCVFFLFFCLIT